MSREVQRVAPHLEGEMKLSPWDGPSDSYSISLPETNLSLNRDAIGSMVVFAEHLSTPPDSSDKNRVSNTHKGVTKGTPGKRTCRRFCGRLYLNRHYLD